jgi:hypothetical protein
MNVPCSDALVFFGATGDLAYKKIFPSDYVEEAWRIVDPVLKANPRSTNTNPVPGDRVGSIKKYHRREVGRTRRLTPESTNGIFVTLVFNLSGGKTCVLGLLPITVVLA